MSDKVRTPRRQQASNERTHDAIVRRDLPTMVLIVPNDRHVPKHTRRQSPADIVASDRAVVVVVVLINLNNESRLIR